MHDGTGCKIKKRVNDDGVASTPEDAVVRSDARIEQ